MYPKICIKKMVLFHRAKHPKDADRMAKSVDPDQTAISDRICERNSKFKIHKFLVD